MLTVRAAIPADAARLRTLAELDSAMVPGGELLIAEEDGRLMAALSLESGECVADPFAPTAAIIEALRAYAKPRSRHRARRRPFARLSEAGFTRLPRRLNVLRWSP